MADIKRYQYDASCTGLGGNITLPFNEVIPVQSSLALPDSGGFGSTRVENFNFRDILSFRSATSVVAGSYSERDETWDTLATVTIEGLNILSTVTADLVVARIASWHKKNEPLPHITPYGSYFVNLRIAGHRLDANLETVEPDKGILDRLRSAFQVADPEKSSSTGYLLMPLLDASHPLKKFEQGPGLFRIPGFGAIQLAHLEVTPYSRRITMFRFELGSTPQGSGSGGGAEGGGSGWTG